MSRRQQIAATVYEISVEELAAAQEAYRTKRTRAADRQLKRAWKAHREAAERLNRAGR